MSDEITPDFVDGTSIDPADIDLEGADGAVSEPKPEWPAAQGAEAASVPDLPTFVIPYDEPVDPAPTVRLPGSWMNRDVATGTAVREILGLPDDHWGVVVIRFATDEICTATVTMFIDRAQAVALAGLLQVPAVEPPVDEPPVPVDPPNVLAAEFGITDPATPPVEP